MAGRLIYNKALKVIHLYLSLVVFIMVFLYIITGYIMSNHNWFKGGEEQIVKKVLPLNYTPDTTRLAEFGNNIKEQFEISGRMNFSRNGNNEIQFMYIKPGERNKVVVLNSLDSVKITQTTKKSLQEISTRIHRVHGFEGGFLYTCWAILLDITAIALILFSLTGILIWLRYSHLRKWGSVILISTTILGVFMYFFLK